MLKEKINPKKKINKNIMKEIKKINDSQIRKVLEMMI